MRRRLTGVDGFVLSLSVNCLTHGEITAHLAQVCGAEVPKQTISTITDKVMECMAERQNHPLDRAHRSGGHRGAAVLNGFGPGPWMLVVCPALAAAGRRRP